MNDLEDLLREELRARAEAAEAGQPDEPAATLLGTLDRRVRVARLRRRWSAAALSAAAAAAAVTLPLTLLSAGPVMINPGVAHPREVPLTDTAATPLGWAPVAYGPAQISVPAMWQVTTRPVCGRGAPGYVLLGGASTPLVARNPRCRQPANMAAILLQRRGLGRAARLKAEINGIPFVRVYSPYPGAVSYFAPALHAVVTARGPLATRVLSTLTRSPLSVVMARGHASPVPESWRWNDFGGIRFAAPASWRLKRDRYWWLGCFDGFLARVVRLSTAAQVAVASCPPLPDTAGFDVAKPGVVIGAGPAAARTVRSGGYVRCLVRASLRLCLSEPDYGRDMLTLAAFPPGAVRPTVVQIGLAGNGTVARTVYDSIRPG